MRTPPGILSVDLGALAANYRLLQERAGHRCEVAGVVKANAYGTGFAPVSRTLEALGCRTFFVATLQEGLALRDVLPGKNITIAVLGGAPPKTEHVFVQALLTPVINSLEAARRWAAEARGAAFLHMDTGMNRLGFSADDLGVFFNERELRDRLPVPLVMSHFASADDYPDGGQTATQYARFTELAAAFPDARRSLANSAGLLRDPAYALDLARPGIALYGGNPGLPENPMRPVAFLEARVLQIREVKEGETIGYGATYTFPTDRVTATVAIGYADGFLRSAGGHAKLYWQGKPCPVLGRVSMDLTSIDITDADTRPREGDMVEVLGLHQGVDDLAQDAGTISYEILTNFGGRYQRVYNS
ncbi:MAG: alanine racemase [Alphaproteobacteria bacterium]|nr:alanine racemase [Alphaproteobacteria bacterium]